MFIDLIFWLFFTRLHPSQKYNMELFKKLKAEENTYIVQGISHKTL
jgi:hypothetical protein